MPMNPYQSPSSTDESCDRTQRDRSQLSRHSRAMSTIVGFWVGTAMLSYSLFSVFEPTADPGVAIIASIPFVLLAVGAYFLGVAVASRTSIKWPRKNEKNDTK